jgi:hypothetical protein
MGFFIYMQIISWKYRKISASLLGELCAFAGEDNFPQRRKAR